MQAYSEGTNTMMFRCKLCYFKQAMADWDIQICKDCWIEQGGKEL